MRVREASSLAGSVMMRRTRDVGRYPNYVITCYDGSLQHPTANTSGAALRAHFYAQLAPLPHDLGVPTRVSHGMSVLTNRQAAADSGGAAHTGAASSTNNRVGGGWCE